METTTQQEGKKHNYSASWSCRSGRALKWTSALVSKSGRMRAIIRLIKCWDKLGSIHHLCGTGRLPLPGTRKTGWRAVTLCVCSLSCGHRSFFFFLLWTQRETQTAGERRALPGVTAELLRSTGRNALLPGRFQKRRCCGDFYFAPLFGRGASKPSGESDGATLFSLTRTTDRSVINYWCFLYAPTLQLMFKITIIIGRIGCHRAVARK